MLKKFNEELMRKRLQNFIPEPLVKIESDKQVNTSIVEENNQENVDLVKVNFLNFLNDSTMQKIAENTIKTYGVGTCGPQTFYGTTDLHEELERYLAVFLHKDECLVFSHDFMTISSTISAYCWPEDVVFVDELCKTPIQHGINVSRSTVVKFAHNNPQSLRQKLNNLILKSPSRLFLILEAISSASGQLCPLLEFLDIAEANKMRVLLDETHSLGVLGETGRGLLEHFAVDATRVDVLFGTLEGALGSVGGFSAGSFPVVEHLRLRGAGWLFSASLPTFLAAVALKGLKSFNNLPTKLKQLAVRFHHVLEERCKFTVLSHAEAPFKVFTTSTEENNLKIYKFCNEKSIFFLFNKTRLVINLNVKLLDQSERLNRVFSALEASAQKINENN